MPSKICEICGLRSAVYVCQECGRNVCPHCQSGLLCKDCRTRSVEIPPSEATSRTSPLLPMLAFMIVFAGVGLIILGSLTGNSSSGSSSSCFFWPIPPIIACGFGSSPGSGLVFPLLGLVVVIILFGLFFLGTVQWRRSDKGLDA